MIERGISSSPSMLGGPSSPIGADLLGHSPFNPHGTNNSSVTTLIHQTSVDTSNHNHHCDTDNLFGTSSTSLSPGGHSNHSSTNSTAGTIIHFKTEVLNQDHHHHHHHQEQGDVLTGLPHIHKLGQSQHPHHHSNHPNNPAQRQLSLSPEVDVDGSAQVPVSMPDLRQTISISNHYINQQHHMNNQLIAMNHSDCSESSDSNSSMSNDPISIAGMTDGHGTSVSISHVHPSVIVESRSVDHQHGHANGSNNHHLNNNVHTNHMQHAINTKNHILQYLMNDQENHNIHHQHHGHHADNNVNGSSHQDFLDQKPNLMILPDSHNNNNNNNNHHHSNGNGSGHSNNHNNEHNNNNTNGSHSNHGGSNGSSSNGEHHHHGIVSSSSSRVEDSMPVYGDHGPYSTPLFHGYMTHPPEMGSPWTSMAGLDENYKSQASFLQHQQNKLPAFIHTAPRNGSLHPYGPQYYSDLPLNPNFFDIANYGVAAAPTSSGFPNGPSGLGFNGQTLSSIVSQPPRNTGKSHNQSAISNGSEGEFENEWGCAESRECVSLKECCNCGTSESPLWRQRLWSLSQNERFESASDTHTKTNSYSHKNHRDGFSTQTQPRQRLSASRRVGLLCSNCQTLKTSLWRRNQHGEPVCNACGLYFKLHGIARPISMKKECIQTRKRKPKSGGGHTQVAKTAKTELLKSVLTSGSSSSSLVKTSMNVVVVSDSYSRSHYTMNTV